MQRDESSLRLGWSLPSAAPLKLNFSARRSETRASLSGAKRKAEELAEEAKPVEVVRTPAPEEEPLASRVRLDAQAVARAEEEKSGAELAPPHDAGIGSAVPTQEVAGRATVEPSRLPAINRSGAADGPSHWGGPDGGRTTGH
ncbi:hypothetical protein C2845_PM08G03710 [Panicum miliaceum]|uniref:Uncharacterized protein n=1 Tax=Panicum miliaceum TaxID=4540 RepID=A0A3L6R3W8_PANMI|nr:hypothetical protein C2845_PM08G03710 [Panicum miliaceum]